MRQALRTRRSEAEHRERALRASERASAAKRGSSTTRPIRSDVRPARSRARRESGDRAPHPHLAFGIGEHFCLGASLARLELRVAFAKIAARVRSIELAGPVSRLHSSFVGGIKRVPIRYRLEPRAA